MNINELDERIKKLEKQVRETFVIPRQLLSAKDANEIEFKIINQYESFVQEISKKFTETLRELRKIKVYLRIE